MLAHNSTRLSQRHCCVYSFLKGRSFPGTIKLSRKDKTSAANTQTGASESSDAEQPLSKSRSPSQEFLGASSSSQVSMLGLPLAFIQNLVLAHLTFASTLWILTAIHAVKGRASTGYCCIPILKLCCNESPSSSMLQSSLHVSQSCLAAFVQELAIPSHLVELAGCYRLRASHITRQPCIHPQGTRGGCNPPTRLCQHPFQSCQAVCLPQHV